MAVIILSRERRRKTDRVTREWRRMERGLVSESFSKTPFDDIAQWRIGKRGYRPRNKITICRARRLNRSLHFFDVCPEKAPRFSRFFHSIPFLWMPIDDYYTLEINNCILSIFSIIFLTTGIGSIHKFSSNACNLANQFVKFE